MEKEGRVYLLSDIIFTISSEHKSQDEALPGRGEKCQKYNTINSTKLLRINMKIWNNISSAHNGHRPWRRERMGL